MANLKAMDSDWFGQTCMGRKSKVKAKTLVWSAASPAQPGPDVTPGLYVVV